MSGLGVISIAFIFLGLLLMLASSFEAWLAPLYFLIFHPTNKARLLVGLIEDRDGWRKGYGGYEHISGLSTTCGRYFHMSNSETIDLKWHENWLVRRAWERRELDIKRQKQDEGLTALAQRVLEGCSE